jgi:hypothetical protein
MKLKSHDLFSIPVFTGQALTKEQIDDIIEFVENLSESQKYHHGLFGSPDNAETTFWNKENALDMIEAQIPSCVNIKKDLQRAVDSYVLYYGIPGCVFGRSWITKQKRGAKTQKHIHAHPAVVSGVLYIKKGNGGETILHNPNPFIDLLPRKSRNQGRDSSYFARYKEVLALTKYTIPAVKIPANDGDLILFPPLIYHESSEHKDDEDRIILAFNCEVVK